MIVKRKNATLSGGEIYLACTIHHLSAYKSQRRYKIRQKWAYLNQSQTVCLIHKHRCQEVQEVSIHSLMDMRGDGVRGLIEFDTFSLY